MLRKILSPIIYGLSGIVIFLLCSIINEITQNVLVQFITIIPSMFVLYWVINRIIVHLEILQNPSIHDHFRHSSLLYFGFFLLLYTLLFTDYPEAGHGLGLVVGLIMTIICFVAIVVNAIFLYRLHKAYFS